MIYKCFYKNKNATMKGLKLNHLEQTCERVNETFQPTVAES